MNKKWLATAIVALMVAGTAAGQVEADIKVGETSLSAMTMGSGEHVVIAIHGFRGTRRYFFSDNGALWGAGLANAGFRVVSFDWSGNAGAGFSELGNAVKHARETGAKKVSLMGFSRGAELAANFSRQQPDGEFDSLVLLSTVDDGGIPHIKTKKLFVWNGGDNIARWTGTSVEKSAEPKQALKLGGSGHQVMHLVGEKKDLLDDVIALLKK